MTSQIRALARRAYLECVSGRLSDGGWALVLDAETQASASGDQGLVTDCQVVKAMALYERGDFAASAELASACDEFYSANPSIQNEFVSDLYCLFGLAADDTFDFEDAIKYHQRSLSIAKQVNYGRGEQRAHSNLGFMYMEIGDGLRAAEALTECADHPYNDPMLNMLAFEQLAWVHVLVGRPEDARQLWDLVASKQAGLSPREATRRGIVAAAVSIQAGDLDAASDLLSGIEIGELEVGESWRKYLLTKADLHRARGEFEEADRCLHELDASTETTRFSAQVTLGRAHLLYDLGDFEQAYTLVAPLNPDEQSFVVRYQLLSLRADCSERLGRWEQSLRDYKQLREVALIDKAAIGVLFDLNVRAKEAELIRAHNRGLAELNKRLRELDAERTELLTLINHDLRGAVNGARLSAELMLQDSPKTRSARDRRMIDLLSASLERVVQITSQIDSFANIDEAAAERSARGEPSATSVSMTGPDSPAASPATESLSSLFDEVVERFFVIASNKDVTLDATCDDAVGIAAPPHSVATILDNLVSNAIKYSIGGGTVMLDARRDPERETVTLQVRDWGVGWRPDEHHLLFHKFGRLATAPTGDESSTGLGLYIAKRHAELAGGTIHATSDGPGQGATFTVELPAV